MTKSIPRPISSAAMTLVVELSLPNTAAGEAEGEHQAAEQRHEGVEQRAHPAEGEEEEDEDPQRRGDDVDHHVVADQRRVAHRRHVRPADVGHRLRPGRPSGAGDLAPVRHRLRDRAVDVRGQPLVERQVLRRLTGSARMRSRRWSRER